MIIDNRTLAKFGYKEKCFVFFGFLGNPTIVYSGDTQELPFFNIILKICKT
jgi:hypothetical protein